ncbi:MAG: 4Fe-4S binding protein [Acidobacteria bacterium]|nr:4Fe-4S binding protein [Acidobacteriota bacterium]
MSRYLLLFTQFLFELAPFRIVGTSLFIVLLSASVVLQAQEAEPWPSEPSESASGQVAEESSPSSPATPSQQADQGELAPGWMDNLLESSEEAVHVDAPGTPPHEHPAADQAAAPHEHPAGASAAEHGVVTADVSVVRMLLGLTLGFALGLMLWARLALLTPLPAGDSSSSNVLAWPVIGRLLRWRHFNNLLIIPTLVVFLFIVVVGFLGQQDTSNPATLLTWILWWPAVVFSFMVLGRIWCVACPFGYMGDLAQKVFSLQLNVPRILKNMWWRLGLFLALTLITTVWSLYSWPMGTAWLGLALTLGAMTLGVIYQKRTFCRYVCPVGGVFGLYAMASPVRIEVKDKKLCQKNCPDKDCAQVCRWFEFAPTMERNSDCNLCLDCVRVCPHNNIVLKGQFIGADLAEFQPRRKSLDEGVTVAAVLGVSLFQTAVMLNAWPQWEATASGWLRIPPGPILYTLIFLTFGLVVPALLVAVIAFLGTPRKAQRGEIFSAFRAYAYVFLPLGLALHAAHNFHHLFGEGGAMWAGLRRWLSGYTGWTSVAPSETAGLAPSLGPNALFVVQWLGLIGGMYLAFWVGITVARRVSGQPAKAFATALPVLLFAVAYTVLNIFILAAPMAHRH